MKKFREWLIATEKEKHNKLIAMRVWMWNQEHGHSGQKKAKSPVTSGDLDYEWINKKATRLGPLDPYKHQG